MVLDLNLHSQFNDNNDEAKILASQIETLNGIMACGECHYCITVQEHTRQYKNGNSQKFTYYCCTKKGETKCHQPYTATPKLEGQFADELSLLEFEHQEFIDWAYEALDETKDKDQMVNKGSFEALQTALEGVNRRIDNLVGLKISPDNSDGSLLSDTEFSDRKRGLMMEKDKITQQLSQINPKGSDWVEVARDAFEFALLAKQRFEIGDSVDKKVVFKAIGVNPILLNQKLQFQLRFIFLKIKEGVKRTKDEIARLEPTKKPVRTD